MQESAFKSVEHYQQVTLLSAGIAGVVVPVLLAQGPTLANVWFLRRAVIYFGACIGLGVTLAGAYRWAASLMMADVQSFFSKQNELFARSGGTEQDFFRAFDESQVHFRPVRQRLLYWMWAGVVGDALFYLTFLRGVAYILEGFML
jgi:hypothetical protein